jgi:hypothetical protein
MTNWLQTPVIDQRNPRWKAIKLGRSDSTIGDFGCLLSAFAMLSGVEPPEMNSRMIAAGAFQTGDCPACASTFDIQKFMPSAPPILDVTQRYPYAPFPAVARARLVAHLKAGNPAILEVDLFPNNSTHDMHFVLAVSAFGRGETANVVTHDPWFADETTLCPRYGVYLARAIVRAIYYGEGTP